ncbi:energy transducer TonB [Desulfothermus sp.]
MRFISLLCSIILHLFIVYISIFIAKNNVKIDLDKKNTYKVSIIRLKPQKENPIKKVHSIPKKARIIKRKTLHTASKKKVIKIPQITKKRIKKKPAKINVVKQKEKLVKSAFKDVLAALKKEEIEKEVIKKEVKNISKNIHNQGDIIEEDIKDSVEKYKAIAEIKIKANWRYPVKQPNLSAEVAIVIDKDGNIIDIKFNKSSGNKIFDNSVVKAIKETKNLDPLPLSIIGKNKKVIITITFGGESEK